MLEEKLRQASQANARHSKRLLAVFGIAILFTAAAILLMMRFNNAENTTPPATTEIPTAASSSSTLSAEESSKLRQQFMLQLRQYETQLAAQLGEANLAAWNNKKEIEINALHEQATSAFAIGDYPLAIEKINALENMARQTLTEHAKTFSNALTLAKKALKADQYSNAKLHIDNALQRKSNDPEALQLARQIEALPKIIALLKTAAIAQTENNLEKEYAAVAEAFDIAPQRQALKQRKIELSKRINENQFTPLIARGLEHVAQRKLSAARADYQQAKALNPKRAELRVLNTAINKLAINLDLSNAIAHGQQAIRHDNWRKAQNIYATALKRHPDHRTLAEGLQLSNKLVSLHAALDGYLQQPERLASDNVATAANDLLVQSRIFAANSPSLRQKSATLKTLLAATNIKIPVMVTSDNQTYILVRGVGKVGLTQARTIQLKAGIYTFVGLRDGYKSKLVRVRIPVGAASFSVEVICNERI